MADTFGMGFLIGMAVGGGCVIAGITAREIFDYFFRGGEDD